MTAFDMFTLTMTGGNRVADTTSLTVIERTKRESNDSWFPRKIVTSSQNVAPSTVTPWSDSTIYIRNYDWTVAFGTSNGGNQKGTYNVRIKVCDESAGLEANCVKYGTSPNFYYKPEGLMQQNADSKRFAVTSYVGNSSRTDGGVLRAKMKYIGPFMPDGNGNWVSNPNAEFGADGLFITDPDNQAGSGGVVDSGVMNYLNKFSRAHGYKSLDPASELFYESLRYFRGQSVASPGPTTDYLAQNDSERGGFPAYTTWNDPIQYWCQKNFIIGINDANPWKDKELPGTHFTSSSFSGENISDDYGTPSNPDSFFDVAAWTDDVGDEEGLTGTSQCIGCVSGDCDSNANNKTIPGLGQVFGTCPYPQKENSYYIAGLAYQANTTDIRPDLVGEQTVSTFMIDTQEYSTNPLVGQMNMLWLAGKYGGFIDEDEDGTPDNADGTDREWDADGDGEPDNYVLATQPERIVAGLSQAFIDVDERTSSSSTVATNSTRLDTDTKVYQARFSSAEWYGELVSRDFNAGGTLGTTETSASIPAFGSRSIFTYDAGDPSDASAAAPTGGISFLWDSLTTDQQTVLNTHPDGTVDSLGSARLDYLSGDQSNEPAFRTRSGGLLGDIINSDPWFVGVSNFAYEILPGDEGLDYYAYRTSSSYQSRTPMVYIGANDGMLHGFRADTLAEEFAFIPSGVFDNLTKLTNPNYSHQYFVDGPPRAGDAYFSTPGETGGDYWRTVLASTTGAGGRSVFALDVSNPTSFSASDILWEFTSAHDADLGYTIGQATVARMRNGRWAVIVGNGYENDGTGQSALFILFLDADLTSDEDGDGNYWDTTGTNPDYVKITTGSGSLVDPNGLATPIPVDVDADRVVDYVYAGDLNGNMWKFDLSSTSEGSWGVAFSGAPLFVACSSSPCVSTDRQPITAKPQAGRHPNGGVMVYFGTGKYFEVGDNVVGNSPPTHTYYGIWDNGASAVTGRSQLQAQTIVFESNPLNTATLVNGAEVRVTSANPVDWSTKRGWYLDLVSPVQGAEGERVVAPSLLRGGRLIFVTLIPSPNPCDSGGTSWIMETDAVSGARLSQSPFDLDDDGDFAEEVVEQDGEDDLPVSGKKSEVGVTKNPTVIPEGEKEYKVLSGSTGDLEVITETGGGVSGRQSWRQIR
jgi:type IV pilus assembly protein PilY1